MVLVARLHSVLRQLPLARCPPLHPARRIHFSKAAAVQSCSSFTNNSNYPQQNVTAAGPNFARHSSLRKLSSAQSESAYVLEQSGLQVESFHARNMFQEAINSVEPLKMVQNVLHFDKHSHCLKVKDKVYTLNHNIYVVGFGKAVLGMARAVEDILGEHIVSGILSIPRGQQQVLKGKNKDDMLLLADTKIKVYEGGRSSYPDETAYEAAQAIEQLLQGKKDTDLFIVLVSGGGSPLLPYPEPPMTLDDLISLTKTLTRTGCTYRDMNIIRKNIERLKGGKMIDKAAPARLVSLVVSDIVGDNIIEIASGPTVHDAVTAHQCYQILKRYNVVDKVPVSIMTHIKQKMADEVVRVALKNPGSLSKLVKTGDDCPRKQRELMAQNVLVGSNSIACQAAAKRALQLGHLAYVLETGLQGEARNMGAVLSKLGTFVAMCFDRQLASSLQLNQLMMELDLVRCGITKNQINDILGIVDESTSMGRNLVIVSGGQSVIDLKVVGGIGGRNCEIALGAAIEFQNLFQNKQPRPQPAITLLSADTDGEDGPGCPAAGAIVNENFVIEAQLGGFDCQEYLDNNNSYALFKAVKGGSHLVVTGMTETNVLDIQILVVRNPLSNISTSSLFQ